MKLRQTILDEAREIVLGDRNEDYGDPVGNHSTTSLMYFAYMSRREEAESAGRPSRGHIDGCIDVCVFNMLQKLSRFAWERKRDCLVDIVGYALNIEILLRGEEEAEEAEAEEPEHHDRTILPDGAPAWIQPK